MDYGVKFTSRYEEGRMAARTGNGIDAAHIPKAVELIGKLGLSDTSP